MRKIANIGQPPERLPLLQVELQFKGFRLNVMLGPTFVILVLGLVARKLSFAGMASLIRHFLH